MDFKVEHELELPYQIFDARFHPTSPNNLIAVATIEGHVHLIESGQLKSQLKKHHKGSPIRKVRFNDQGHLVSVAKTIKIHDLESNETTLTLRRDDDKTATFYSTRPFGNNIISAGDDDGSVFVWDTRTPEKPVFTSSDCEQYISDIDGKFEARKLMVCTSGEGTLTAYDLRTMKMIEPQSELFEAGFQCVKLVEPLKKVVIGGEDGAVYVFNHNEWAHTSGKFAISSDLHNRGKCSIDCMEVLPDNSTFLVGCSDGKMRALTLWPHQILSEEAFCKKSSLESIHVHGSQIVITGDNYINIVSYEEKSDEESAGDESGEGETQLSETSKDSSAVTAITTSGDDDYDDGENEDEADSKHKKLKTDTDDYLNVFH